jgi:hypothetical protein
MRARLQDDPRPLDPAKAGPQRRRGRRDATLIQHLALCSQAVRVAVAIAQIQSHRYLRYNVAHPYRPTSVLGLRARLSIEAETSTSDLVTEVGLLISICYYLALARRARESHRGRLHAWGRIGSCVVLPRPSSASPLSASTEPRIHSTREALHMTGGACAEGVVWDGSR